MLSFTKRIDYGLIAMANLAGSSSSVSARELANRNQLSYPLLANVLKGLCNADLVTSLRGKNGGYRLVKDPAFVTVKEVIEAVEGPFRLADCTGTTHAAGCGLSSCCSIKWSVNKIHEAILEILGSVTLADVVAESRVGAKGLLADSLQGNMSFHEIPLNLEV